MPDREACATELATAVDRAPAATKDPVAGHPRRCRRRESPDDARLPRPRATIANCKTPAAECSASGTASTRRRSCSIWRRPERLSIRVRALRGYIGLARQFAMPDRERAEMCQNALDTAKQAAEQKLVLEVLKIHPSKETLKLAIKAIQTPALKDDATQATLGHRSKTRWQGDRRQASCVAKAGLGKVKLEIVKAEYGAGSTQRDVTSILQKQAGDLPLISLPAASLQRSLRRRSGCRGGETIESPVPHQRQTERGHIRRKRAHHFADAQVIAPRRQRTAPPFSTAGGFVSRTSSTRSAMTTRLAHGSTAGIAEMLDRR